MPTPEELSGNAVNALAEAENHLAAALEGVDATAVLASYALVRLSGMSRDGIDRYSRPGPVAVEYAAWLLFPHFGESSARDQDRIQKAIDALEACNSALVLTEIFAQSENGEKDDRLAVHLRLHSGMVRGSAYPQQLKRRIEGVLKPFEVEFASLVGIGPWRAFEIANAIGRQIEENIAAMRERFQITRARGDALFAKQPNITPEEQATLKSISDDLQRIVAGMEGDWVATFTQIAARLPGLQRNEWDSLRGIVGLTTVSRALVARIVDVQDRPIYYLSDERAMLVQMTSVFDAIFAYFDDLARSSSALANRYGKQVADYMEAEIERLLLRIFPNSAVYRNACFPDPDNPGGETEADAVVVWGPFLVVAEAKGRRLAREAMRGSKTKLRQAIQNNIQDAFYQARRVVRVLERDGKVIFKERATGRTVEIEKDRLNRVMPLSVTLQHLSGIPTQLALTQKLGLFKGKAYPWSVSIDDLEVVTRFVGSPDAFLHYIERRTAHQSSEISFNGDELDVFGQYLDNRLHPSVYETRPDIADHDGPRMIAFSGGEERFEKVYFAEWEGEESGNLGGELSLPAGIQAIMRELRNREDDGARWIAFALLGLSQAALLRLTGALDELRKADYGGKSIQRITAQEGDVVINVMAHAGLDAKSFHKNTEMRTRLEHYRFKPRATLTLGIDQRDPTKAFATASWIEGPWEKEQLMEKLLAEDREKPRRMQLVGKGTKPGRNELCPCGSGKKFKRCCIDRLTFERSPTRRHV